MRSARDDDRKALQSCNDFVGCAEMFVKDSDFELVFYLGPIGEFERHTLVIIENRATDCHFASPIQQTCFVAVS